MPPVLEENILYVVLHGLITLIDIKEQGFLAHVLEIGDDHQYLLGEWLQEAVIPGRERGRDPLRATLKNVDSGAAKLDPSTNAVLKLDAVPIDTTGDVRAVLQLPRPRKFYNFVRGKLPEGALEGEVKRLVQVPDKISGTVVFEYTFQDKDKVALVSDSGLNLWKPKALAIVTVPPSDPNSGTDAAKTLSLVALHVYDEPGFRLPGDALRNAEEHNRREFKLSGVFLNSTIDLVKKTAKPDPLLKADLPPGLLPGEVTNLDERDKSVRAIVIGKREGEVGADAGGGSAGPVCGGIHATLV